MHIPSSASAEKDTTSGCQRLVRSLKDDFSKGASAYDSSRYCDAADYFERGINTAELVNDSCSASEQSEISDKLSAAQYVLFYAVAGCGY